MALKRVILEMGAGNDLHGGNYTKAAQLLKMSLRSFRYKLQKFGIDREG